VCPARRRRRALRTRGAGDRQSGSVAVGLGAFALLACAVLCVVTCASAGLSRDGRAATDGREGDVVLAAVGLLLFGVQILTEQEFAGRRPAALAAGALFSTTLVCRRRARSLRSARARR
jgi:hypothetical protein